jgi:hypothetical protein
MPLRDGVRVRPWYDEFLIPGYDKGTPGRQVKFGDTQYYLFLV